MQVLKSINALNQWRDTAAGAVGFVPTMGALHAGHLSLIEQAQAANDQVVVSIYVNPTQFDQAADLEQYPNTLDADISQLQQQGVDALFLPDYDLIYPDGFVYKVVENEFSQRLCGAHRPGHFDGVLSVVMKLFNLVRPDRAYFGSKDYQQFQLIKGMADAFFLPLQVEACPIIRETDGLAMSSRNLRLDPVQRKIAPQLYATLKSDRSLSAMQQHLESIGFEVDYLEVVDGRLLAAAYLGEIRLIDNVPHNQEQEHE